MAAVQWHSCLQNTPLVPDGCARKLTVQGCRHSGKGGLACAARCTENTCVLLCPEEIERCREAVKAKLQRRQAQVSDLNEVQALLAKLEAVFQLPQRLRVAINAKAYALAVDNYISARPVLKRAGYKVRRLSRGGSACEEAGAACLVLHSGPPDGVQGAGLAGPAAVRRCGWQACCNCRPHCTASGP